jgi:hypothetical protein
MSSIALKAQIALPHVLNAREEFEDDATQARYAASQDTRGDEYKKAKKIILGPKNEIKHMNDDSSDATITIDPISEARKWIEHALINLKSVSELQGDRRNLPKSPTMWQFEDSRAREIAGRARS